MRNLTLMGLMWLVAATTYGQSPSVVTAQPVPPNQPFLFNSATGPGSGAFGMSELIRAQGDRNLQNSAAMLYQQEAARQAIRNRQDYANTYFSMRKMNGQMRAAQSTQRLNQDQLARIAHEGAPRRLSFEDFDSVNGQINWPKSLMEEPFAGQRQQLEKLFLQRSTTSSLNEEQCGQVTLLTEAMLEQLKDKIKTMKPDQYLQAKKFLHNLAYEGRFPAT